jgi:cytochrome c oxidase subunit 3
MAVEIKIVEEAKKPLAMNPKKFAMWLFIVSVIMIFAALDQRLHCTSGRRELADL